MNAAKDNLALKVGVIASTYPRNEEDYAVPWMRESVSRITARGHKVQVIAPSYKGLSSHAIDGVPVHRFRYAPSAFESLTHEQGAPNKVHRPWMQALAAPYVASGTCSAWSIAKREQFDVMHVHWPFPHGVMGVAAAKATDAALVMNCHGAEFAVARRKKWVRPLLAWALKQADLVIANSEDTASKVHEISGRESTVIPYGATIEGSRFTAPAEANISQRSRLLFTGRLIERKGVDYLLRALPEVLKNHDTELVITGAGDQKPKLQALTDQLGLSDRVRFLGFVSTEELNQQYAECDVWVNPSVIDSRGDTEGLGVGSIEAYSHRKPVVASAVGGIPDTVRDGETGLLVPEKNEQALASAINSLLNDPTRRQRMGEAGLAFAKRRFDWDRLTDQLVMTYRKAIDLTQGRAPAEEPAFQVATDSYARRVA